MIFCGVSRKPREIILPERLKKVLLRVSGIRKIAQGGNWILRIPGDTLQAIPNASLQLKDFHWNALGSFHRDSLKFSE